MSVVSGLPNFRKASDFAGRKGLNMVIFGPPGVGKTTLACSAQDSEYGSDVLLFDIEGGCESVTDRSDIAVWPGLDELPDLTWAAFRKVVDQIVSAKGESPYKTLVFDSLSAIYYDLILPKVTGSREKQPQQNQWGEANRLLVKFISDVMVLNSYGINTLFIGHVQEYQDGDVTIVRLAGTPQGRDEVLRVVGNVGHLGWDRRLENRVLSFKIQRRVEGPKFRQNRSGNQVPEEIKNPTMHDILQHVRKQH